MNIQSIKELVGSHSVAELRTAENELLDGKPLSIEVDGADEGEQLTHVLAAVWVLHYMETNNVTIAHAMREYSKRVRESIR